MSKTNGKQFLYTQLSDPWELPEAELKIRHRATEYSGIQVSSENQKLIGSQTQISEPNIVFPQQKILSFKQCGGLSEY